MRLLITGQVGLNKSLYLEGVKTLAEKNSTSIIIRTTGEMMVDNCEPKIDEKTILNLPKPQLDQLRRFVWKFILDEAKHIPDEEIMIVNSHSILRWQHGMFPAIDLDSIQDYAPHIVVTLIDNINDIKQRLVDRGTDIFELWELIAWREEEIWMTKFLAESLQRMNSSVHPRFYVLSKKQESNLLYRIITEPSVPKVYISFPITNLSEGKKKGVQNFK